MKFSSLVNYISSRSNSMVAKVYQLDGPLIPPNEPIFLTLLDFLGSCLLARSNGNRLQLFDHSISLSNYLLHSTLEW